MPKHAKTCTKNMLQKHSDKRKTSFFEPRNSFHMSIQNMQKHINPSPSDNLFEKFNQTLTKYATENTIEISIYCDNCQNCIMKFCKKINNDIFVKYFLIFYFIYLIDHSTVIEFYCRGEIS
jgi:hypothetical protein